MGISVQIGPRWVGRCYAAWGLALARDKYLARLVVATIAAEAVLAVVMVLLSQAATSH